MSAASVLSEALALIANPSSFTVEDIALDRKGNPVGYESDKAVKFCVVGALLRVKPSTADLSQAAMILRRETGPMGMFEFEERQGHSGVVKMMKRAIAAAEVAA